MIELVMLMGCIVLAMGLHDIWGQLKRIADALEAKGEFDEGPYFDDKTPGT